MSVSDETKIAVMARDIEYIKGALEGINRKLDVYVTRSEMESRLKEVEDKMSPIQKVIYGAVGVILLTILGAVIELVMKH